MILTVLSFTESVRVQFSRVYTIPWTVAGQTSLSMDSPGKNTGVGCHFPAPGDLPNPVIKLGSLALQVDSLPTELPRKPYVKNR